MVLPVLKVLNLRLSMVKITADGMSQGTGFDAAGVLFAGHSSLGLQRHDRFEGSSSHNPNVTTIYNSCIAIADNNW